MWEIPLDVPARLSGDHVYVSVQMITQILGGEVYWDEERRAVFVTVPVGLLANQAVPVASDPAAHDLLRRAYANSYNFNRHQTTMIGRLKRIEFHAWVDPTSQRTVRQGTVKSDGKFAFTMRGDERAELWYRSAESEPSKGIVKTAEGYYAPVPPDLPSDRGLVSVRAYLPSYTDESGSIESHGGIRFWIDPETAFVYRADVRPSSRARRWRPLQHVS